LAFTYAPPMNAFFGSTPLGHVEWLKAAGVGALVFAVVETEKYMVRRLRRTPARQPEPAA
jgi:hypothetical protein